MGKITNIVYEVVDPRIYDTYSANEFYWYQNMLGLNSSIDDEYINYQEEQLKSRNVALRDMRNKNGEVYPTTANCIFGTSSRNKNVVLIADY